jgi:hypothetical protein
MRVQGSFNIFYRCTPILAGDVPENSQEQYEILSALAQRTRKLFPYLKVEFCPTLTDARPYLDNGWSAMPEYTHTWDIRDLNALLKGMHRKQTYVNRAQEMYDFSTEYGDEIINDFLRLYIETMKKYDWEPPKGWRKDFSRKARWLSEQDLLRPFTCRFKNTGELVGVALYILSRENRTAYYWLIGYDHKLNSKEFPPAIHYHAAKSLAGEFDTIDFGEGGNPSLFAFKDSLGTDSIPYWVLTTGESSPLKKAYRALKIIREKILP